MDMFYFKLKGRYLAFSSPVRYELNRATRMCKTYY